MEVWLRLALTNFKHTIWITRNIVFEAVSDLGDILKAVSTFHFAIFSGANIEQLREEFP